MDPRHATIDICVPTQLTCRGFISQQVTLGEEDAGLARRQIQVAMSLIWLAAVPIMPRLPACQNAASNVPSKARVND